MKKDWNIFEKNWSMMLGLKYVPCGHVGSHYCDIFVYYSSYFPMPTMYLNGPSNCFYHLKNFRKNRFLPQKPALPFSPSTWNTIGHFCKPPTGMLEDQNVRKGPSPSILRATIGKSWHCQNWRSPKNALMKRWQKYWAGPFLPLIWTKSKRTDNFFRKTFPYRSIYNHWSS